MPPAILVAIATFVTLGCAQITAAGPLVGWWGDLAGSMGLTGVALLLAGMLHLRQRIAAVGFALMVALRLVMIGVSFDMEVWRNATFREGMAYGWLVAHLVVMVPLAVAVWPKRRGLAICAVASALLTAPPPALAQLLYDALVTNFRQFHAVELVTALPEYIILFLISVELARAPEPRPAIVADGLRHGYRAMCVFSALAGMFAIGAVRESLWLPGLQAVALGYFAYGLLRASRLPVSYWQTTLAATMVLLAAGVLLMSLPPQYGHSTAQVAVFCIVAAWLVTRALDGLVDKTQLQAKGVGSIVMFSTAFAIVVFLVPHAQTEGALVALRVLNGFVLALGAWMLSWLCRLAADKLERRESDIPTARVV